MIDELFKQQMDRGWDAVGRVVAKTGVTPNGVTWISFVLSAGNALAFLFHQNPLAFGLLVAVVELLDNVDGAVARVTGASSREGAYLDATTDRYKDVFILLAIGHVMGDWLPVAVAISGSLITSYAAARAAMLGAHGQGAKGWPDLFERLERIATICIGLVFTTVCPPIFGHALMFWVLWFVAGMTQITAAQRFTRRLRELRGMDRAAG